MDQQEVEKEMPPRANVMQRDGFYCFAPPQQVVHD